MGVKDSKALLRAWIGKSRIENVNFVNEVEERAQQLNFCVSWRKVLDVKFPLSDVETGDATAAPDERTKVKGKKQKSLLTKIEETHLLLKEYIDAGKIDIGVMAPVSSTEYRLQA